MSRLPELAMRYRTIVLTLVVLFSVLGAVAFQTMPRREDPEFTIMTCVVSTRWEGVPATRIEQLITDPLEEVLVGIDEVHHVRSSSVAGLSTIFVDLLDSTSPGEVHQIWDKVRARVANVEMPAPEIRPVVFDDFGDTSVIVFSVYQTPLAGRDEIEPGREYSHRDLDIYSDRVRDALRHLPGVARVQRFAVREEGIFIEADSKTWTQHELRTDDLRQVLTARNIVQTGGSLDTGDGRIIVSPSGDLVGVGQIDSIVGSVVGGDDSPKQVYLEDFGLKVRRAYREPPSLIGRYSDTQSSRPAVMVSLTMKSGSNIVEICQAARERVERLKVDERQIPPDIAVAAVSDQSSSVNARIHEVLSNVLQAIAIVILVVYLAVGFRVAAVMAANIPVVMLASIAIVPMFGVQLEQMSLASMIIALGLLVDNAVQVCDQARTNQLAGMNPRDAAIRGAQVLAFPMLNGTLTTIAAFMPMVIVFEGGNREFIYSLPVTLSVMLGVSWVLAMTFCVILAATVIRAPSDPGESSSPVLRLTSRVRRLLRRAGNGRNAEGNRDRTDDASSGFYVWSVSLAIRYRVLTIAIAIGLLMVAMRLPVATEFFPLAQRDQFAVGVWLPENASIAQTDEVAQQVEDMIRRLSPTTDDQGEAVERLRGMRTLVGGGGSRWYLSWIPEPLKPNYAEILVRTTDGRLTHGYAELIRSVAVTGDASLDIAPITGARVVPIELQLGPPAAPVTLRVSGEGFAEIDELRRVSNEVKALIRAQPGVWNVHDSWGADCYGLRVDVDPDRASLAGVSNAQVADTLSSYLSGRRLTTFREGDRRIPVYFKLSQSDRDALSDIEGAFIEGSNGRVLLPSIASVQLGWQPGIIERRDSQRTVEVRARVEPGYSGNDIVAHIMGSPEMTRIQETLRPGYSIQIGGALEESQEATVWMLMAFAMSLIAVLILLVIQFNSIAKSLIIILTLPLALIGALLGLWITDNALGFMPQLGILALFGIVVNTAIIYIEFADIVMQKRIANGDGSGRISGLSVAEFRACLAEAGRQRLVPIFLTTATTVGGLLSLALAGGPLWIGMSWLMVFGLLVATLLTLYVIPAAYAFVVEYLGIRPVS